MAPSIVHCQYCAMVDQFREEDSGLDSRLSYVFRMSSGISFDTKWSRWPGLS